MREPPVDLPSDALCASLCTNYGLAVADLTFLPLGHDSSAWVYRVRTADDTPYFLKVRKRVTNTPSLLVQRYLHDHGVAQVIAPLPTATQTLWAEVDGYALILYPFVAGTAGKDLGMAPLQWIAYGAILRQVHATALAPDLAQLMQRETFVPAAESCSELVVTKLQGKITRTVRGPETKATPLGDCPAEGEWLGIQLKLGTFLPHIIIKGNVPEEVARLKQQSGRDILVYGSGQLVQRLIEHDLVDEFRLMVYPIVLGSGKRLFVVGLDDRRVPRRADAGARVIGEYNVEPRPRQR